jgi:uncharacterized protein Smg (DUF494 family)
MTETNKTIKRYPTLECSLAMSKAKGNLKFLAESDMATFTQGEAVIDALNALQQAYKEFGKVTKELSELRDGLK